MLAVIGENVVDMLPDANGGYRPCLGGSPFNVVIGAARQNIDVSYISPLSQDAFGQQFASYLQQHGGRYGLPFFSTSPSAMAVVSLDAHRQPQYSLYRQGIADRDITAGQQIDALNSNCKLLHLGSLALEPADSARIRQVLQYALAQGIKLAVDINVRLNAVTDVAAYRSLVQYVVSQSHFIKASDEDLQQLFTGLSTAEAVKALRQLAPAALLALTEGDKGATLYWQHHQVSLPVIPAQPFTDTVGAGDTFWANLLAALIKAGIPEAEQISTRQLSTFLQRAMLAASLNIARQGCQPPDEAELNAALIALR